MILFILYSALNGLTWRKWILIRNFKTKRLRATDLATDARHLIYNGDISENFVTFTICMLVTNKSLGYAIGLKRYFEFKTFIIT